MSTRFFKKIFTEGFNHNDSFDQQNEPAPEQPNLEESNHTQEMKQFVVDKLENTDMDVDQLEKAFVKKFGASAKSHYRKILDKVM